MIKMAYPNSTDGIYWIKNTNINGGIAFQVYVDMTTDGVGWMLFNVGSGSSASSQVATVTAPDVSGLPQMYQSNNKTSCVHWYVDLAKGRTDSLKDAWF
jgi:hypothetical protein